MPITTIEFSLFIAFVVGLASTVHCVGMCSGIAGGLSASLPHPVRDDKRRHFSFLLAYNLGRVTSYAIAGAVVGGFSQAVFSFFNPGHVHLFIHLTTTMILVLIALYLMGIFPKFASLQYLGKPIWKHLEPVGRKLLPVKTLPKAFGFGLIWGWLPCGLVYSVLVWSLASGSAWQGAVIMMAFGLGTFPTLIFTGFLSTWIISINKLPVIRALVGCSLLVAAMYYLIYHDHVGMFNLS